MLQSVLSVEVQKTALLYSGWAGTRVLSSSMWVNMACHLMFVFTSRWEQGAGGGNGWEEHSSSLLGLKISEVVTSTHSVCQIWVIWLNLSIRKLKVFIQNGQVLNEMVEDGYCKRGELNHCSKLQECCRGLPLNLSYCDYGQVINNFRSLGLSLDYML